VTKPVPKNEESPFDVGELFFSRTDKRGVIEGGNSVFARVSCYPLEEMVGKAHNLVRHPDMPKSVFKYFWEILKSNEPILAYVKNMASDGRYYWVLAAAFPTEDGYVSIRLKPTSKWFETIKSLYATLLQIEQSESVDKSYSHLLEAVSKLGYSSYREMMREALTEELASRDRIIAEHRTGTRVRNKNHFAKAVTGLGEFLHATNETCDRSSRDYDRSIRMLSGVGQLRRSLISLSGEINDSYSRVQYLSINMAVASEHTGSAGATLTVVAETFRQWSAQAQKSLSEFTISMEQVAKMLDGAGFTTAASRLQLSMISFYADEISALESDVGAENDTVDQLIPILEIGRSIIRGTDLELRKVYESVNQLRIDSRKLGEALSALYIVYQNGKVEVARLGEAGAVFEQHLKDMATFVEEVMKRIVQIEENARVLHSDIKEIMSVVGDVSLALDRLDRGAVALKRRHKESKTDREAS